MDFWDRFKARFYPNLLLSLIVLRYIVSLSVGISQSIYTGANTAPADLIGLMDDSTWNQLREPSRFALNHEMVSDLLEGVSDLLIVGLGLIPRLWNSYESFCERVLPSAKGSRYPTAFTYSRAVIFYLFIQLVYGIYWTPFYIIKRVMKKQSWHGVSFKIFEPMIWKTGFLAQAFFLLDFKRFFVPVVLLSFILYEAYDHFLRTYLGTLTGWTAFADHPGLQSVLFLLTDVCDRTGFPIKKILLGPGSNAYSFGVGRFAILLVGVDLIEKIGSSDAIVAIIGHEIGHWYYNHLLYMFIESAVYFIFLTGLFFVISDRSNFVRSFGFIKDHDQKHRIVFALLISEIFFRQFQFYFVPVSNAISWIKEYQADEFAAKLGYGHSLHVGLTLILDRAVDLANLPYGLFHSSHPIFSRRLGNLKRFVA